MLLNHSLKTQYYRIILTTTKYISIPLGLPSIRYNPINIYIAVVAINVRPILRVYCIRNPVNNILSAYQIDVIRNTKYLRKNELQMF